MPDIDNKMTGEIVADLRAGIDGLELAAADEIERLQKCLDSRDQFLLDKGLFQEFADQLPNG